MIRSPSSDNDGSSSGCSSSGWRRRAPLCLPRNFAKVSTMTRAAWKPYNMEAISDSLCSKQLGNRGICAETLTQKHFGKDACSEMLAQRHLLHLLQDFCACAFAQGYLRSDTCAKMLSQDRDACSETHAQSRLCRGTCTETLQGRFLRAMHKEISTCAELFVQEQ